MEILGKEINDCILHGWPKGYVWEDDMDGILTEKNDELTKPDQMYYLADFGYLSFEDNHKLPLGDRRPSLSFSSIFLKWKKKQTTTTFLVDVPNSAVGQFKIFLKSIKGKVTR